jgi:hypothetical protein
VEIVWLPKAIGEGGNSQVFRLRSVTPKPRLTYRFYRGARVLNFRPALIHQTIPKLVQLRFLRFNACALVFTRVEFSFACDILLESNLGAALIEQAR